MVNMIFVGFRVPEGTSYLHGVPNDQFLTSVLRQSSVTLGPSDFPMSGDQAVPPGETAQMPAVEMKHLGIESDPRFGHSGEPISANTTF